MTAEVQATDNDKLKSRYQRWRDIAHQMENEIHAVNQLNKSYASLYFKAMERKDAQLTELHLLRAENAELQAALKAAQPATKANAVTQTPPRQYQRQNHFTLHRPLVMDAPASTTSDQQHFTPASSSHGRSK